MRRQGEAKLEQKKPEMYEELPEKASREEPAPTEFYEEFFPYLPPPPPELPPPDFYENITEPQEAQEEEKVC